MGGQNAGWVGVVETLGLCPSSACGPVRSWGKSMNSNCLASQLPSALGAPSSNPANVTPGKVPLPAHVQPSIRGSKALLTHPGPAHWPQVVFHGAPASGTAPSLTHGCHLGRVLPKPVMSTGCSSQILPLDAGVPAPSTSLSPSHSLHPPPATPAAPDSTLPSRPHDRSPPPPQGAF